MSKPVTHFSINARRDEDARILAKLNAAAPYFYKDCHKVGRRLLERALDQIIGEHNIDWRCHLPAVGR